MGERLEAVLSYVMDEIRKEAEKHGTAFVEVEAGEDKIWEIGDIEIIMHGYNKRIKLVK